MLLTIPYYIVGKPYSPTKKVLTILSSIDFAKKVKKIISCIRFLTNYAEKHKKCI